MKRTRKKENERDHEILVKSKAVFKFVNLRRTFCIMGQLLNLISELN